MTAPRSATAAGATVATAGSRRRRSRWWYWPWRLVRALLLGVAALWFLFEEIGWHPLAAWLGRLARWGPWARFEARIAALPPRPALLLFLVPVVALFPVKLFALRLLHDGRHVAGITVIVVAKLVGTAIGGWLFLLLRRQLMRIKRFARAMAWWRLMRRRVRRALRRAFDWQALRASIRRMGRRVRRGFGCLTWRRRARRVARRSARDRRSAETARR